MGTLTLCDIKGPLHFQGLPPFVLTSLTLLLCCILFVFLRRGNRQAGRDCPPAEHHLTAADTVEQLIKEYNLKLISDEVLFCRLAEVVSAGLVGPSRPAGQTSGEILRNAADNGTISTEYFQLASRLLLLCDQVKFSRFQPPATAITWALTTAKTLLTRSAGGAP